MHETNSMVIVAALLLSWGGAALAAEAEGLDASRADIVAYVYDDGTRFLTLGGTDLERRGDVRAFDLSGAPPELRERVMRDFLAGDYDGVFLGPLATADEGAGACGSISKCAREVSDLCRFVGSSGSSASIKGGCSGTCADGTGIAILCPKG